MEACYAIVKPRMDEMNAKLMAANKADEPTQEIDAVISGFVQFMDQFSPEDHRYVTYRYSSHFFARGEA